MRSFLKTARFWASLLLAGLGILFAFQNMAPVEITILFWTVQSRRIAVILLAFALGFAIAWLLKSLHHESARKTVPERDETTGKKRRRVEDVIE